MHDLLFENQDALEPSDVVHHASVLQLDLEPLLNDLRTHRYAERVHADVRSGLASGVYGTPTLFINGRRYERALDSLGKALARAGGESVAAAPW